MFSHFFFISANRTFSKSALIADTESCQLFALQNHPSVPYTVYLCVLFFRWFINMKTYLYYRVVHGTK